MNPLSACEIAILERKFRVILLGGSSHAGKTTLAHSLAEKLGWRHISTDSLARHPGRPWQPEPKTVPKHVAEHYLTLSIDELLADVLRHYEGMWSGIESTIILPATDGVAEQLILEGSALWPETVATLNQEHVGAIWLTVSDDEFQTRIYSESRYEQATPRKKVLIDKFLGRTLLYNKGMLDAVESLGLASLNVEGISSLEELHHECVELINRQSEQMG